MLRQPPIIPAGMSGLIEELRTTRTGTDTILPFLEDEDYTMLLLRYPDLKQYYIVLDSDGF